MEENKEKRLEFRGGSFFAVLPLILFVVVCIMLFVVFKVFEMEGLCMGGILVLIVGSLFSKDWSRYWRAVVKGMTSEMMNTLALILLVVGIFAKMMSRGGVAQGFVWRRIRVYRHKYHIHVDRNIHRYTVLRISDPLPVRNPARSASAVSGRRDPVRSHIRRQCCAYI